MHTLPTGWYFHRFTPVTTLPREETTHDDNLVFGFMVTEMINPPDPIQENLPDSTRALPTLTGCL